MGHSLDKSGKYAATQSLQITGSWGLNLKNADLVESQNLIRFRLQKQQHGDLHVALLTHLVCGQISSSWSGVWKTWDGMVFEPK